MRIIVPCVPFRAARRGKSVLSRTPRSFPVRSRAAQTRQGALILERTLATPVAPVAANRLLVVEAFRFMHRSQRFGCLVYPLLLFVSFAASRLFAQDSTSAPPPSQPQSQQQPENPQQDQVHLGPGGPGPDTGSSADSGSRGRSRIPTATNMKSTVAAATSASAPVEHLQYDQ